MPGAIRSGFAYQDLIAMREIIVMLKSPREIQFVELEAEESGSLDDVVVHYYDGRRRYLQVKFAVNAADLWTWSSLTATPSRAGPRARSLLTKWLDSVVGLPRSDLLTQAEVITNRGADEAILRALDENGTLRVDLIPAPIRRQLVARHGTECLAKAASHLTFRLRQNDIAELRNAVERGFAEVADPLSFGAFADEVRAWGEQQHYRRGSKLIDIDEARRAAGFYRAIKLPEAFAVPDDFVVPSQDCDRDLVALLRGAAPALLLLLGDAGAGKSTYVSDLYRRLRADQRAVVRHHFWLSADDATRDRFSARVVASSLMTQLAKDCAELLGELSVQSPNPDRLGEWLDGAAMNASSHRTSLIVIVDGLDHVLGTTAEPQLDELMRILVAPRDGLKVLLASQPRTFGASLTDRSPVIIRLPRFERRAIAELLRKNGDRIVLPKVTEWRSDFDDVVDAIAQRTGGLPLHLSRALRLLETIGHEIEVRDVQELPKALAESAGRYYARVWPRLSEDQRLVLHLIAAHNLPWQRADIIVCLSELGVSASSANAAIESVYHLLEKSTGNVLTLHSSLIQFVRDRPDHVELQEILDRAVVSFLRSSRAPENWRWMYLPILTLRTGCFEDVVASLDRDWFATAIAMGRMQRDVSRIVQEALYAAITKRDLVAFVRLAIYHKLYATVRSELIDAIVVAEIVDRPRDQARRVRPSDLSASALRDVVIGVAHRGDPDRAAPFMTELRRRLDDDSTRESESGHSYHLILSYMSAAGALGVDFPVAATWISNEGADGGEMAAAYVGMAARFGHIEALREVLRATQGRVRRAASRSIGLAVLCSRTRLDRESEALVDPSAGTIRLLLDRIGRPIPAVWPLPILKEPRNAFDTHGRLLWLEIFHHILADALIRRNDVCDAVRRSEIAGHPSISRAVQDVTDALAGVAEGEVTTCSALMARTASVLHGRRMSNAWHPRFDALRTAQSYLNLQDAYAQIILDCMRMGYIEGPATARELQILIELGPDVSSLADSLVELEPASQKWIADDVPHCWVVGNSGAAWPKQARLRRYLDAFLLARYLGQDKVAALAARMAGVTVMTLDRFEDEDVSIRRDLHAARQSLAPRRATIDPVEPSAEPPPDVMAAVRAFADVAPRNLRSAEIDFDPEIRQLALAAWAERWLPGQDSAAALAALKEVSDRGSRLRVAAIHRAIIETRGEPDAYDWIVEYAARGPRELLETADLMGQHHPHRRLALLFDLLRTSLERESSFPATDCIIEYLVIVAERELASRTSVSLLEITKELGEVPS
jgi:hypothetical protein